MNKLERLEKKVLDAAAAYVATAAAATAEAAAATAAWDAASAAYAEAAYAAWDAASAAYAEAAYAKAAYVKARDELKEYIKEQQDND